MLKVFLIWILASLLTVWGQAALPEPFRQRLQALAERHLDGPALEPLAAAEPALANLLVEVLAEAQWTARLKPMLGEDPLIDAAAAALERQTTDILQWCAGQVEQPFLGDSEAAKAPDLLVILGGSHPNLEARLQTALALAARFPDVPIIASGGGRTFECEAELMERTLLEHGVDPGRILREELSLDTLGNAVFSKLLARARHLERSKVLVVTSSFHGPRSRFLFRQVFGPGTKVAVALAATPGGTARVAQLMESELTNLATTARTILTLPPAASLPPSSLGLEGDECGILAQMLLEHELYRYRWDIARQFHDGLTGISAP